jgi:hypothetical protein
MRSFVRLLVLLIGSATALRAADIISAKTFPKHYIAYKTTKPLKIDGKLDDASWLAVPWTDDFVDIEGNLKPPPRYRTRAKMLWDDGFFYIGAELEEPHVWATLTKRDTVIYNDNDFEVFIDPNGDSHEYYEFEMNALNTVWDLLLPKPYKDGGRAVESWNIEGLKTAVHVRGTLNNPSDTDSGWSVEIAMPWGALQEYAHRPVPPREGDQWRVNFSRVEWLHEIVDGKYQKVKGKPEDNWVWSPQGVINMHRPETWGYVQFSAKKPGKAAFRPDAAWEVRCILHEVYYVQREFRDRTKQWAQTLDELNLKTTSISSQKNAPTLQSTNGGFVATLALRLPNGKTQLWHIRQDALIWAD